MTRRVLSGKGGKDFSFLRKSEVSCMYVGGYGGDKGTEVVIYKGRDIFC